jgi:hypothetical protein
MLVVDSLVRALSFLMLRGLAAVEGAANLMWAAGLPDALVSFQTKTPNLGKFWRVLQWNLLAYCMASWSIVSYLVYFMVIWYIFAVLVYFMVIWFIFFRFGMLYQDKSGNPGGRVRWTCGCENDV